MDQYHRYDRAMLCLSYKQNKPTKIRTPVCVWVNVSPVRAFPELLLKRPDDDLLHPLIGLGDEVHSGALRADLYFLLPGFPDDLNEQNIKSTCLRF